MAQEQDYLFDNTIDAEETRLQAVEAALDSGTIHHLQELGVDPGMHCLEVGGGGGSITGWLCDRVGPGGSVTATDLEPRYLQRLHAKNLEVLRHNILDDPLPQNQFDFAHVRWLLHHLKGPRRALSSILKSLKPGGWLLAEEIDFASVVPDLEASEETAELFSKYVQTMKELLAM